jgi:hypothetical protein
MELIEEECTAFEIYHAAVALGAWPSLIPTVQGVSAINLSSDENTNNLVKKALD